MNPDFVASATVGYCNADARATTSSFARSWRCAGVKGLSGTSSACSSAFRWRPIALDGAVDVVFAASGVVGGAAFTPSVEAWPPEDEQPAASATTARPMTKRVVTAERDAGRRVCRIDVEPNVPAKERNGEPRSVGGLVECLLQPPEQFIVD